MLSVFDILFQFWSLFLEKSFLWRSKNLSTLCFPLWSLLVSICALRFLLFLSISYSSMWLVWFLYTLCSRLVHAFLFSVSPALHGWHNWSSSSLYFSSFPIIVVLISFIDSVQLDLSKDDKVKRMARYFHCERETFTEWLDEISHKLHTPRVEKER